MYVGDRDTYNDTFCGICGEMADIDTKGICEDCSTYNHQWLLGKAKALVSWLEGEEIANAEHPDHEKAAYHIFDLSRDIKRETAKYRQTLEE